MKEEFNNPPMDPDLEVRIVALVLGEASELEREQLSRLIEERPELAAFRSEIEAAHRLMRHVGLSEWSANENDWKLSPENRDAVLAVIRGEPLQTTAPSDSEPAILQFLAKDKARWNLLRIAAAVCGAGVFGLLAMAAFFLSRTSRMAQSDTSRRFDVGMSSADGVVASSMEAPATSDGTAWMFDGESSSKGYSDFGLENAVVTSQPDHATNSESALSDIRDNLGTNLTLPLTVPELNLPADVPELPNVVLRYSESRDKNVSGKPEFALSELKGGYAVVAPESDKEMKSYSVMVPDEQLGAKNESLGKSVTPYFGVEESAPQPVAPQSTPKFRGGATFEANRAEVVGKAIDGLDFDHDGSWEADGVWADGRTPQLLIPEDEEKPQGGKDREAEVDRPMDIAGVQMNGRQPTGGGFAEDGFADGGIAIGRFFDPKGIEDSGVDRHMYLGNSPSSTVTPKAPMSSPQDAKEGYGFGDRASGGLAWERQNEGSLSGILKQEVQSRLNSAGQSLGEVAIDEKLENAEGEKLDLSRQLWEKIRSIESTRGRKAVAAAGLDENNAAIDAFSTFSLHVSDVSFKLAQAALARGEWPEATKVRIEEFVNAFDYGDPMPSDNEKVACRVEQTIHPFLQQRNLLRVSMRTAAAGRASSTPLRITFLLDNSGSMERIDRQQTVRSAFALLAQQLTPIDQVTLISFSHQPRLLADKVNGAQSKQLVDLIDELPSEGGTNLEAALKLAMEKATEQQLEGAQNRIVLLTDGAVNLGDANPERLSTMVTAMRDAGIAFDAAGISAEGLNDEVLEALTRKGDGRYYLLDSVEAADDGFVRQIAGALRPSAKNVKVQVEFNPKRVGRYKLLGYEKHMLNQEDFRNDNVDAAEMAAAEAGVAVYQFESLPSGEGDVGSVSVRFRDLSTGEMVENRWPIPYEADAQRPDQAAPSMCVAASAALFAAKLRGEPLGEAVDLKTLSELLAGLPEQDRNAKRVQQLQSMINQARQVAGSQ